MKWLPSDDGVGLLFRLAILAHCELAAVLARAQKRTT
jgi:hypothetical protein